MYIPKQLLMKTNLALLLSGVACLAEAALVSPTSIFSNDFTAHSGWSEVNIINKTGLTTSFVDGVTDLPTYQLSDKSSISPSIDTASGYFAFPSPGSIVFDLGQSYNIDDFLLWNDTDTQGINNFTIAISDDSSFGAIAGSFSANATFGDVLGGSDYDIGVPMQVFDSGGSSGRYVRLTVNSLHGSNNLNIGEVAFNVNSAVPVPAAAWLFGTGLIGLVSVARRKAKS